MPLLPLEREADLIEYLVCLVPKWLRHVRAELSWEREVAVGRSIADVVICIHGRGTPAVIEPLSVEESVILAMLRLNGPTRIDLLEERCGLNRHALRRGALDRLRDCGVIRISSGGRIEVRRPIAGGSQLLAIEGKLRKWRPALRQALVYRRYAERSYVALPAEIVARNSISLSEFSDTGVGLISVSAQDVREVVPAVVTRKHDWRREFVLSRMISRVWTYDTD